LRHSERPASRLEDAGFLGGDGGQGVAQQLHVVKAQGRDARRDWRRADVGRVQPTADANFQDGDVHAGIQEAPQAQQSQEFEVGGDAHPVVAGRGEGVESRVQRADKGRARDGAAGE